MNPVAFSDADWLDAAAALAARGRPFSHPNPAVGALIVKHGRMIGRGWTQPGGRPHAEAQALLQAGEAARGATAYVTLEPCAHDSPRGPACAHSLRDAGLARVVIGCEDPDPRTAGAGIALLREAGIAAELVPSPAALRSLEGYLTRAHFGRPHTTLKLATSLDGCIAMADGTSQWITGPEARAHGHAMRARCDAILVGGETLRADSPRLDVRLPGLAARSPARWVLTRGTAPEGWQAIADPADGRFGEAQYLLIEGGAGAAAAFLAADSIDRLLLYRAPILIGAGRRGLGEIGLASLAEAQGRWCLIDQRRLGSDTLDVYDRIR
ncbi:bifunctional diaminohydroxyphosphoribosylaminopyrimidine deaminase/5-amino-6-(5-phosphoribosylamino)uracil reductase RibD [Novosphingobium sp.]|uniref:bifunctional diaminohydroxyphosphoribosylaminopyrimidine deaminase/5-amino-6-(5-phosphoribosylamino)uracil reductase RibD n=1 Tax=Novosphingobium sp. TaxID=1874826 RepID=UPI003BADA047